MLWNSCSCMCCSVILSIAVGIAVGHGPDDQIAGNGLQPTGESLDDGAPEGACPGEGDCCVSNGSPGCSILACCQCVCSIDPFCCDTTWDGICAGEACDDCNPQCACCPCGDPGAGDCCGFNPTPFCDDADCCECVCALDPFCCDIQWDLTCADQAADDCCAVCECAQPSCFGCPGEGDCCISNGSPGCSLPACCQCVCSLDPFCCDTLWDSICAGEACDDCNLQCTCCTCGDPGAGDCCSFNFTPACDDADCCDCVCALDPFCCDIEWDPVCAGEACENCGDVCDCCAGCACLGDLDDDGFVTFADLVLFLECLNTGNGTGECLCADFDGDGFTTFADLVLFLDALTTGQCA